MLFNTRLSQRQIKCVVYPNSALALTEKGCNGNFSLFVIFVFRATQHGHPANNVYLQGEQTPFQNQCSAALRYIILLLGVPNQGKNGDTDFVSVRCRLPNRDTGLVMRFSDAQSIRASTCRRTTGLLCTSSYAPLKQSTQSSPDINGLVISNTLALWLRAAGSVERVVHISFSSSRKLEENSESQTESITHLCLANAVDRNSFGLPVPDAAVLWRGTERYTCSRGATRTVFQQSLLTGCDTIYQTMIRRSAQSLRPPRPSLGGKLRGQRRQIFHNLPGSTTSHLATSSWSDIFGSRPFLYLALNSSSSNYSQWRKVMAVQ
ncbi:conserved hypothetical protein [Histoplasma capsulatum H143]|uniref:Uncharacterized protein n=1 Tax=Ajellomyces capsulatus (strain H143) TaxID=544712 RepID=C6HHJ0_AJECH|nr:conserved hypothetical protein [Histoplasma capsulatum H143]